MYACSHKPAVHQCDACTGSVAGKAGAEQCVAGHANAAAVAGTQSVACHETNSHAEAFAAHIALSTRAQGVCHRELKLDTTLLDGSIMMLHLHVCSSHAMLKRLQLMLLLMQGVCHRDLKLDNTLLDGSTPPRLKICDFGFSKSEWFDSQPKSMVGTRNYFAPEARSQPGTSE